MVVVGDVKGTSVIMTSSDGRIGKPFSLFDEL